MCYLLNHDFSRIWLDDWTFVTIKFGLFFVSSSIFPTYSPITPKLNNVILIDVKINKYTIVNPDSIWYDNIGCPIISDIFVTKKNKPINKQNRRPKKPKWLSKRNGSIENDVKPLIAWFRYLNKENFVLPEVRLSRL